MYMNAYGKNSVNGHHNYGNGLFQSLAKVNLKIEQKVKSLCYVANNCLHEIPR